MKYLIVTGGTLSGCGKGTTISSIGVVLRSMGYSVTAIKIDPYLNVDAGTMSPYEHGEVFVLEDGGEGDLDLGNYERALGLTLTRDHNITTGKIYQRIITQERKGEFLGRTVQMVPHVTDCVQEWIERVAAVPTDNSGCKADVCLIEVGGTVGDIESSVYLEALQQFCCRHDENDICLCHLTYLPNIFGELKTKPAQHSVKILREAGLRPSFIFCRSQSELQEEHRRKIALFCQVPQDCVVSVHDVSNTYEVALVLDAQDIGKMIGKKLDLSASGSKQVQGWNIPRPVGSLKRISSSSQQDEESPSPPSAFSRGEFGGRLRMSLDFWRELSRRTSLKEGPKVVIGLIGKYTAFSDAYLSVIRALEHSAIEANLRIEILRVESADFENPEKEEYKQAMKTIESVDGVLCPGGFGERGIHGKVFASKYCREHMKPYLGICLGLQTAVIDFARNVLSIKDADSEEFNSVSPNKVVVYMPETADQTNMGGTMRLGNRATIVCDTESLAYSLYDRSPVIFERHRHRYEVNPTVIHSLEKAGMRFVGRDERGQRMEILELENHPFFLATQFHPEFTSLPYRPNPCFLGFVLACANLLEDRLKRNNGCLRSGYEYYERFFANATTATTTTTSSGKDVSEKTVTMSEETPFCENYEVAPVKNENNKEN